MGDRSGGMNRGRARTSLPNLGTLVQTYTTADGTLATPAIGTAPAATAATSVTPFGYSQTQADAIKNGVINLITDVDDLRQFVNSLVDKLQAGGLLS